MRRSPFRLLVVTCAAFFIGALPQCSSAKQAPESPAPGSTSPAPEPTTPAPGPTSTTPGTPGPTPEGTSIGTGGGTVQSGGASAEVPAGALPAPATIAIAVVTDGFPPLPADARAAGSVFAFTPHGQTFTSPVTIRVPFTLPAKGVPVLLTAAPGGSWSLVEGATVVAGMLEAKVSHFSYYSPVVQACTVVCANIDGTGCPKESTAECLQNCGKDVLKYGFACGGQLSKFLNCCSSTDLSPECRDPASASKTAAYADCDDTPYCRAEMLAVMSACP